MISKLKHQECLFGAKTQKKTTKKVFALQMSLTVHLLKETSWKQKTIN